MDDDANADDSPDVQESLMGALIGARGVPGGLQAVAADLPANAASDPTELTNETAELLGISDETRAAVSASTDASPETSGLTQHESEPESEGDEAKSAPELTSEPETDVETSEVKDQADVETVELEAVEPETIELETIEPETVEPETVEPETIEPAVVEAEPDADSYTVPLAMADSVVDQAGVSEPEEVSIEASEPEDNLDDPDPQGVGRAILEWAVVLVGAVVMALVLRQFIFQAFWIPSESMETTLEIRDRVLVNRLSYQWGDVGRGDIVVFARRPEEVGEIRDLIKRVIGLPGDTVQARDNAIFINGVKLDEPYIAEENRSFADFGPVTVPGDELFVMGDNRDQSFDSRFFGTVETDRVAGRAFVTFWPLDRVGSL